MNARVMKLSNVKSMTGKRLPLLRKLHSSSSDPQHFKSHTLTHPILVEKYSFVLAADIFNQLRFNQTKCWDCTVSSSHVDPGWQMEKARQMLAKTII